jgi:hypothetical protein
LRLRAWLQHHEPEIATRWLQELKAGSWSLPEEGGKALETVATYLVSFLPSCFGEKREAGMDAWRDAAHLYGSLGLRRGLATGEVVEEFHLLRHVIFRLFLLEPESGSRGPTVPPEVSPLDLLTLNRVLDMGVTGANVAYVDELFFAHLQGSGVPEGITTELAEEMERQLRALRKELEE